MFQRAQLKPNSQRHLAATLGIKKVGRPLPPHIIRRKLCPLFGATIQLCREEHELSYREGVFSGGCNSSIELSDGHVRETDLKHFCAFSHGPFLPIFNELFNAFFACIKGTVQ
jgi:hypothetical protein